MLRHVTLFTATLTPFALHSSATLRAISHLVLAVAHTSVFVRDYFAMSSEPKHVLITGAAGDAPA